MIRRVSAYLIAALACAFIARVDTARAQGLTVNNLAGIPVSEFRLTEFLAKRGPSTQLGFSLMLDGCLPAAADSTFHLRAVNSRGINPAFGSVATPGHLPKWISTTGQLSDSILFESKAGMIGIGTDSPTSKLTVMGLIESKGGGLKFPDGTIQTTSASGALFSLMHDTTLTGDGTAGMPLGLKVPVILSGQDPGSILKVSNTGNGPGRAIEAHGSARQNSGIDDEAGAGVFAAGGDGLGQFGFAGAGVDSVGGNSASSIGGFGVRGQGGDGQIVAGDGVFGRGGHLSSMGTNGTGVMGVGGGASGAGNTGGTGVVGSGGFGSSGATDGLAGSFEGSVEVAGDFNVTGGGTKNFKIDHPLDPENKYLYHAAIESSEVLNIYSGNVTTDSSGEAVVTLPDWFEAINRDFRYQLTVFGTFPQAKLGDKIKHNRFTISTTAPGVEVSWQVTAVRSDAAMLKHPFRAEHDKPESERGHYLSPDAYGQPEERGVQWARHPQLMQQLKQQRIEAEQTKAQPKPDYH